MMEEETGMEVGRGVGRSGGEGREVLFTINNVTAFVRKQSSLLIKNKILLTFSMLQFMIVENTEQ